MTQSFEFLTKKDDLQTRPFDPPTHGDKIKNHTTTGSVRKIKDNVTIPNHQ